MHRSSFVAIVIVVAVAIFAAVLLLLPASRAPNVLFGMPPVVHRENLYSEAGGGAFQSRNSGRAASHLCSGREVGRRVCNQSGQHAYCGTLRGGSASTACGSLLRSTHVVGRGQRRPWARSRIRHACRSKDSQTWRHRVRVPDAYNLYFTPDGNSAIIVAEEDRRLDFRDPHTMQFQQTVRTPECRGINHADFALDGSYAIFSCEFGGNLIKFDVRQRRVIETLKLPGCAHRTERSAVLRRRHDA